VSKHVDFVVANDVLQAGAGFEVETNVVTLVGPDWEEALPLQSKSSIAGVILDRIFARPGAESPGPHREGASPGGRPA
jgi:phosphopantothenoylcysteine decarboxylase/phosphopantothenate--cysteine ligase